MAAETVTNDFESGKEDYDGVRPSSFEPAEDTIKTASQSSDVDDDGTQARKEAIGGSYKIFLWLGYVDDHSETVSI
jgi:hypothetical protein